MTNLTKALKCVDDSYHPISTFKLTENTRSYFEKLIKKIKVVQQSKSLPNNYLSCIKFINRGRLVCKSKNCFQLSVSEKLVERAINFLESLSTQLEHNGFKIKSVLDNQSHLYIVAIKDSEQISFHLAEGYKYTKLKSTRDLSILDKLLYSNNYPQPTGKLTITLFAIETKVSRSWIDSSKLIECRLPLIVEAFTNLITIQKERRIQNELRQIQRNEFASSFKVSESKRFREKALYAEALQEAMAFNSTMQIETYLSFLELKYLQQFGKLSEHTANWLEIVRNINHSNNPIHNRIKLLG